MRQLMKVSSVQSDGVRHHLYGAPSQLRTRLFLMIVTERFLGKQSTQCV
jgi:hypothetical protein